NEDVACFLNGYIALWHPTLLLFADGPPRISSPYDHEQPTAGHVYAVPQNPPLILPDDWDDRVREAGAIAFRATPDRATTLANLRDALSHPLFSTLLPEAERGEEPSGSPSPLRGGEGAPPAGNRWGGEGLLAVLDLPPERVAPFFGLGFGY